APLPSGLRHVLAQEDVDAYALLAGIDRDPFPLGHEKAGGAARLVSGILVDDRVDGAANEVSPRERRQLMRDEHDVARPARLLECGDNAAISGAGAIDPDKIVVVLEKRGRQFLRKAVVVPALAYRQQLQVWKIARD